jgi:hypothetical protein
MTAEEEEAAAAVARDGGAGGAAERIARENCPCGTCATCDACDTGSRRRCRALGDRERRSTAEGGRGGEGECCRRRCATEEDAAERLVVCEGDGDREREPVGDGGR